MNANTQAWYRNAWPWLLMLPPLAAVIGGVSMIILANKSSNPLVVSDYSQIEAITAQRFARDAEALRLGLDARIELSESGSQTRIRVLLNSAQAGALPNTLSLVFQHSTSANLDQHIQLHRTGSEYETLTTLATGTYLLDLGPPDESWRLAGRIHTNNPSIKLQAQQRER